MNLMWKAIQLHHTTLFSFVGKFLLEMVIFEENVLHDVLNMMLNKLMEEENGSKGEGGGVTDYC